MRKRFVLLAVVLVSAILAAVTTYVLWGRKQNTTVVNFTGTYRDREDVSTAQYLSVAQDGSYVLYYVNDPVERGTHSIETSVLVLQDEQDTAASYLVR